MKKVGWIQNLYPNRPKMSATENFFIFYNVLRIYLFQFRDYITFFYRYFGKRKCIFKRKPLFWPSKTISQKEKTTFFFQKTSSSQNRGTHFSKTFVRLSKPIQDWRSQCGDFIIFLYITHILREINIGDSKRAKSATFTPLESLNFDIYEIFHLLKDEIYQMDKIQSPKNDKNGS